MNVEGKYEELYTAVEQFIDDVRDGSDNWNNTFGRLKELTNK